MIIAQTLGSIGLAFSIAGTAIIWRFGLPQPSSETTIGLAVEEGTVFTDGTSAAEHDRQQIAKRQ